MLRWCDVRRLFSKKLSIKLVIAILPIMQLWFWAAVAGAVFAGVSNFYFKQAAARGYNAELFSIYSSILSITISLCFVLYFSSGFWFGSVSIVAFFGGFAAAFTNIFKVYALRFIDATIYFPLYKLLAPALAVVAGIMFFEESFTTFEWVGIIIGLLVPLLLITKSENSRQSNLMLGLVLVLVTSITSAGTAIANKYAIDLFMPIASVLLISTIGIFVGGIASFVYKNGFTKFIEVFKSGTTKGLLLGSFLRGALITASFFFMLVAFAWGGPLGIVQTINSMYILIPIVLSIIFYNEHWNVQKAVAIVLSILALAFLH